MKFRNKVVFDIREDKFKYLHRDGKNKSNKVDIVELNKRLNYTKKINIYTNAKIFAASLLFLGLIAFISVNF